MPEKTYIGTVRVPTDQYAYVEIEVEGTPEEIMDAYREMRRHYSEGGGVGLPDKEWREALDLYLWDDKMEGTVFNRMSDIQQAVIQECKKSKKRRDYEPVEKLDYGRISKESAAKWRMGQGVGDSKRSEGEAGE